MFQGSILGPLLLLSISGVHCATKYSKVHHFADDTNLMNFQTSFKTKKIIYDLKNSSNWLSILKKQLDLVTMFSKDTGMKFGQNKCGSIKIEKEKNTTTPPEVNGLKIKLIREGESYRYSGQDETVAYDEPINKESVSK